MLVSKEISAVDLTAETFEQIKATEPKVVFFITLNESNAMALAKAIDEKGISESNVLQGFRLGSKTIS